MESNDPEKKGSIKQDLADLLPIDEVPHLEALMAAERALEQWRMEEAEQEAEAARKAKGEKKEKLPPAPRTAATKRGYLSARNKRATARERLIAQRADELRKIAEAAGRPITESHSEDLAEAWLAREVAEYDDGGEYYVRRWHELAPTSRAVPKEDRKEEPEMFAMRNLTEILGMENWWVTQMMGRPGFGLLQWAAMLMLAFGSKSKDMVDVLAKFDGKNASFAWSYGNPAVPGKRDENGTVVGNISNVIRQGIRRRMEVKGDEAIEMAHDTLLALARRHASLRGPDDKLLHPDAFKTLYVDAQWIPVDEPQRGMSAREEAMRPRRPMSKFRSYKTAFDRFKQSGVAQHESKKEVRGYMQVTMQCAAMQDSVKTRLVPANDYEPRIAWKLFKELKKQWPECPTEFLVADGLYSWPRWLPQKLLRRHGVVLISPPRKDWKSGRAYSDTLGTPHCDQGCTNSDEDGNPLPMKFKDSSSGVVLKRNRDRRGMEEGVEADNAASGHVRYVCPVREKDPTRGCAPVNVYLHTDAQLYSPYPHSGSHKRVADRKVMLARRNQIESMHSVMKELGWAKFRLRFGGDPEHELILTLAHIMLTARRIVHENGDYDRAVALWAKLGLSRPADSIEPGLALDPDEVAQAVAEYRRDSVKAGLTALPGGRTGYHRDNPPPSGKLYRQDTQRRAQLYPDKAA